MFDPSGLEVLSDETQGEEPEQSGQQAAEDIQVAVCLSVCLKYHRRVLSTSLRVVVAGLGGGGSSSRRRRSNGRRSFGIR